MDLSNNSGIKLMLIICTNIYKYFLKFKYYLDNWKIFYVKIVDHMSTRHNIVFIIETYFFYVERIGKVPILQIKYLSYFIK